MAARRRARELLIAFSEDSRQAQALRESLNIQIQPRGGANVDAVVETPFYWAVYYHDGRGPIRAKPGKFLVFFVDPDDDPRHDGSARNYPVRFAGRKRLTRQQFYQFLSQGKIIAVKRVGPARSHPFFERISGEQIGTRAATPVALRELTRFICECLDEAGVLALQETAEVRLF